MAAKKKTTKPKGTRPTGAASPPHQPMPMGARHAPMKMGSSPPMPMKGMPKGR